MHILPESEVRSHLLPQVPPVMSDTGHLSGCSGMGHSHRTMSEPCSQKHEKSYPLLELDSLVQHGADLSQQSNRLSTGISGQLDAEQLFPQRFVVHQNMQQTDRDEPVCKRVSAEKATTEELTGGHN